MLNVLETIVRGTRSSFGATDVDDFLFFSNSSILARNNAHCDLTRVTIDGS